MDLERTGLRFKVIEDRPMNGGRQVVVQFGNGYGASVVRGPYTYGGSDGLFEVAVLLFDVETNDWHLPYATPVTDDVLGHLTEDEVARTLTEIHDLPHRAITSGDRSS